MNRPRPGVGFAVVCLLFLGGCRGGARPAPAIYADALDPARSGPLVLVGDFQRTCFGERVIGREQNDAARATIVAAIAREPAAAVVVLGDMVFDGSSRTSWEDFDRLAEPIRAARLPVLPVLGNHDYWGDDTTALRHARARFPALSESTWYARRAGSLGLVWLNTNRDALSVAAWSEQGRWFTERLAEFDRDPVVKAVIVFGHHPPYTNSRVTGDEEHVQAAFVPAFGAAMKTVAYVSGHAHAYEHFSTGGKHFIVSGGGGGPRVELLTGEECRHADLYSGPSPRPFHYIRVALDTGALAWTVIGFDRGEEETRVIDSFETPLPAGSPASPSRP